MPDDAARRCRYATIDRATRCSMTHASEAYSNAPGVNFSERLRAVVPTRTGTLKKPEFIMKRVDDLTGLDKPKRLF